MITILQNLEKLTSVKTSNRLDGITIECCNCVILSKDQDKSENNKDNKRERIHNDTPIRPVKGLNNLAIPKRTAEYIPLLPMSLEKNNTMTLASSSSTDSNNTFNALEIIEKESNNPIVLQVSCSCKLISLL